MTTLQTQTTSAHCTEGAQPTTFVETPELKSGLVSILFCETEGSVETAIDSNGTIDEVRLTFNPIKLIDLGHLLIELKNQVGGRRIAVDVHDLVSVTYHGVDGTEVIPTSRNQFVELDSDGQLLAHNECKEDRGDYVKVTEQLLLPVRSQPA